MDLASGRFDLQGSKILELEKKLMGKIKVLVNYVLKKLFVFPNKIKFGVQSC